MLSIQPLIALIKHGEQIGFYLDSDEPYFRLKIETAHAGTIRCALVPESFREFPESLDGRVRVMKLFPENRPPYNSILEIDGLPLRDIVNRVLTESYQVNSVIEVARDSDQSAMLHQLPLLPGSDEYDYSLDAVRARRSEIGNHVRAIMTKALVRPEDIRDAFAELDFRLLASREIRFHCPCSRPRMIRNILLATGTDWPTLFDPGQEELEITCEYCKDRYAVGRIDLERAVSSPN